MKCLILIKGINNVIFNSKNKFAYIKIEMTYISSLKKVIDNPLGPYDDNSLYISDREILEDIYKMLEKYFKKSKRFFDNIKHKALRLTASKRRDLLYERRVMDA